MKLCVFHAFLIIFCLSGCASRHLSRSQQASAFFSSTTPAYHQLYYWAAHPWKKDPSDSLPADLRYEKRDTVADVFFIHPTTYTQKKTGWNAVIDDEAVNKKTDYSAVLYQASVFNQHCRIFAPRYRQAHLSAFFNHSAAAQAAFDTAYDNIKTAFEYYLQYYNQGRPIIIAGHSQGSKMAGLLLKEFFDGKPLQKQLIAAYLPGWPVSKNYFQNIPVCSGATQTGCFCTWRTFLYGYVPEYITKEEPPSYVTNPLTWETNNTYAGHERNKGSVLRNFDRVIKNVTDAQVHEGVLWVNKPRFPGSLLFTTRNYHIGDINLFYMNLRENIEVRIREFLKQQQ